MLGFLLLLFHQYPRCIRVVFTFLCCFVSFGRPGRDVFEGRIGWGLSDYWEFGNGGKAAQNCGVERRTCSSELWNGFEILRVLGFGPCRIFGFLFFFFVGIRFLSWFYSSIFFAKMAEMRFKVVGWSIWSQGSFLFAKIAEIAGQGRKVERRVHFIRENGGNCGLNSWGKAQGSFCSRYEEKFWVFLALSTWEYSDLWFEVGKFDFCSWISGFLCGILRGFSESSEKRTPISNWLDFEVSNFMCLGPNCCDANERALISICCRWFGYTWWSLRF